MTGSIFVLSGEELTLPFAEIRALVQTYSKDSSVELLGSRVVSSSLSEQPLINKVTERAAYCRFGGTFIATSKDIRSLAENIDPSMIEGNLTKSFAVESVSLAMNDRAELGGLIKDRTGQKVSLENPDLVFQVEKIIDGEYVLAFSDQGFKKKSWKDRRPRARRFFLPSAIFPKFARLLVNLSRVKEGEIFVDPFCGTGSLLIESSIMGIHTAGFEITRWIARGSALNLQGFSLPFDSIIRADSCAQFLPIRSIDAIATDVPYGRASSTKGLTTEEVINRFLGCAKESMRSTREKKRYCVVMHPSTVNLNAQLEKQGNSFQLREQHLLYVHRNLTRAISVLERTEDSD